jgi:hypothetical protein
MASAMTLPAYGPAPASDFPKLTFQHVVWALAFAMVWIICTRDWLSALSLLVLGGGWFYLRAKEGPPVLALAFTFQWCQVTCAIIYSDLTGRHIAELEHCDPTQMVLLGLGCLTALLMGLHWGRQLTYRPVPAVRPQSLNLVSLALVYVVTTLFTGIAHDIAFELPMFTQIIITVIFLRYALLFLLLRRFSIPKLHLSWVALMVATEIGIGIAGYFAGFREAIIMAALALLEAFDRRKLSNWVGMAALAILMVLSGTLWTGVKHDFRRSFNDNDFAESQTARFDKMQTLSADWFSRDLDHIMPDVDQMITRLWAVYYPALAVRRVPSVLPHSDGAIMERALEHVLMPRILFPEKPNLVSDSNMVRKYSGVWVAGDKQGTSIAFSYAAESYIDFGLVGMFFPVLLYGLVMGMAYEALLRFILNREIAVGVVTAIFWLSLYLFERSWIKMLGASGTLVLVLGTLGLAVDRLLSRIQLAAQRSRTIRAR